MLSGGRRQFMQTRSRMPAESLADIATVRIRTAPIPSHMSRHFIESHAEHPDRHPAPYPASRAVAQWLKDMPMDRPFQQSGPDGPQTVQVPTVKQCPPFIEAMTCGY